MYLIEVDKVVDKTFGTYFIAYRCHKDDPEDVTFAGQFGSMRRLCSKLGGNYPIIERFR